MNWNNPEEVREYMRQYRETHKEEQKVYNREYRETPRGRAKRMVIHCRQNDAKHNRGECTITEEWIMENIFTSKCHYCGESDWLKLGCDRIDNAKPHTPENIVCCCEDCNRKRQNMPFAEFVQKCKEAGEIVTNRNRKDQSKPCIAINDAGEVVYEFPSTREAARNGFDSSSVSCACRGCYLRDGNHRYRGLLWFYKE